MLCAVHFTTRTVPTLGAKTMAARRRSHLNWAVSSASIRVRAHHLSPLLPYLDTYASAYHPRLHALQIPLCTLAPRLATLSLGRVFSDDPLRVQHLCWELFPASKLPEPTSAEYPAASPLAVPYSTSAAPGILPPSALEGLPAGSVQLHPAFFVAGSKAASRSTGALPLLRSLTTSSQLLHQSLFKCCTGITSLSIPEFGHLLQPAHVHLIVT